MYSISHKKTNRIWDIRGRALLAAAIGFSLAAAANAADHDPGKRDLSWQKTPASLALLNGGTVVWQFNHLQDGKEKGCPYFHPLATMEGAVLTDLRPGDHLWHRGLRFAWKKIKKWDGKPSRPQSPERLVNLECCSKIEGRYLCPPLYR